MIFGWEDEYSQDIIGSEWQHQINHITHLAAASSQLASQIPSSSALIKKTMRNYTMPQTLQLHLNYLVATKIYNIKYSISLYFLFATKKKINFQATIGYNDIGLEFRNEPWFCGKPTEYLPVKIQNFKPP